MHRERAHWQTHLPEAGSSTQVMPSKESNDVLPHVFFFIFACLSKLRARSGARVSGGLDGGWAGIAAARRSGGSGGGVAAAAREVAREYCAVAGGGGSRSDARRLLHLELLRGELVRVPG